MEFKFFVYKINIEKNGVIIMYLYIKNIMKQKIFVVILHSCYTKARLMYLPENLNMSVLYEDKDLYCFHFRQKKTIIQVDK